MLWRRMLSEDKANYRRIYKSLVLLNYLLRNGSERVVTSAREHVYDLRTLENFTYIDELGKDQGVNIRHRAKQTIEFLQDDNRLREERKKAKKNKDKYVGVSSGMMASSSSRYMDEYDEDYSASTNSNVFKDEREERKSESPEPTLSKTVSSPAKAQQPQSPDNLSARSKPTKNYASKKIDLGAAADYAKQHQQEPSSSSSKPSDSQATSAAAQSDILFDLEPTTTSQSAPHQPAAQVADLLDSLTITATSITPTQENFADFSKVFNDEPQASGAEIQSTATTKDDDEFDDFRFSPLPAQQTTPVAQTTTNQPKATTQDDLLGLDLGGPQSLPLQMNVHNSSSAGLSPLFFPTTSNSGGGGGGGSNPSIFQADNFLTPLTPSKPTTLNIRSAEQQLREEEEPPKQSPTASAILSKKNTWSGMTENLKIDLDNLLQSKKEKPKPSMNQMAATRTGSNNNVSQTFAQGEHPLY